MSTYAPTADKDELLDFDIEPRRSAEPVPAGRWDVMVKEFRNATARASGNPYKQTLFVVIAGEHTDHHPNAEQWDGAEILSKQPWVVAMVAKAEDRVTLDPTTGKEHVSATVGQLIDFPLVIDLIYETPTGFDKEQVKILRVYHPDDAPRDDLDADDTPMGVENEDRIYEPTPAPAGRPPAPTSTGKLSRY